MTAVKEALAGNKFPSAGKVFVAVGSAMMSSMGGASGAIFDALVAHLAPLFAQIPLGLTLAVLHFLLVALAIDLALGLGQHAQIVLGVLGKVLGIDAVARKLRIAVQLGVFLDDLLGSAAHLAIRTGAVEHPVDDVAAGRTVVAAVLVAPRP